MQDIGGTGLRRKNKEVAEPEILQYILEQAPTIRIAMCHL